MSLIAKDKPGNFTPAPAGNHVAVCISLIDIGMQHGEYQGKETHREQVIIGWELSEELMPAQDGQQQEPFTVSEFFTNSLSEKSKLRPMLESWRGRPFTDTELEGFDLTTIVGKPCMVNVVHEQKKDGVRAKVSSVTPLPKSMPKPRQIRPSLIFDCDNPDAEIFNGFSEKMKALIQKSDNWKSFLARGRGTNRQPGLEEGAEESDGAGVEGLTEIPQDDDIPFDSCPF